MSFNYGSSKSSSSSSSSSGSSSSSVSQPSKSSASVSSSSISSGSDGCPSLCVNIDGIEITHGGTKLGGLTPELPICGWLFVHGGVTYSLFKYADDLGLQSEVTLSTVDVNTLFFADFDAFLLALSQGFEYDGKKWSECGSSSSSSSSSSASSSSSSSASSTSSDSSDSDSGSDSASDSGSGSQSGSDPSGSASVGSDSGSALGCCTPAELNFDYDDGFVSLTGTLERDPSPPYYVGSNPDCEAYTWTDGTFTAYLYWGDTGYGSYPCSPSFPNYPAGWIFDMFDGAYSILYGVNQNATDRCDPVATYYELFSCPVDPGWRAIVTLP